MARQPQLRFQRRSILVLLLLAIGLYAIVPQLGSFRASLHSLRHPLTVPLLAAIAAVSLSYAAAAGTYCLLAFRPLRYGRTLLVQLASLFMNRLLPAGVGALGVNFLYLRRNRHTTPQATAVVAANNLAGLIGHSIVLLTAVSLFHSQLPPLHVRTANLSTGLRIAAIVAVIGLAIASRWRHRVATFLRGTVRELAAYRKRPAHLVGALLTSMLMTLTTIGCLYFCLLAVHVHLAFVAVLIVFSVGLSIGTATPTPGGLGGLEAGLVAGLVAYHVPSAKALAGVLLYRLLSYWLSLLVGGVAFAIIRRQRLLQV